MSSLSQPVNVNVKDKYGLTQLMYAVQNAVDESSEEVVSRLLKLGANLECKNKYGFTALMFSVHCYTKTTVRTTQILLDAGALIDARNNCEETALLCADSCPGNVVLLYTKVKILLDAGADINAKNNFGGTALLKFVKNTKHFGMEKVVNLLLEYGADVNAITEYGDTALKEAVRYAGSGSTKNTVKTLLEAGGDSALTHSYKYAKSTIKLATANFKTIDTTFILTLLVENTF